MTWFCSLAPQTFGVRSEQKEGTWYKTKHCEWDSAGIKSTNGAPLETIEKGASNRSLYCTVYLGLHQCDPLVSLEQKLYFSVSHAVSCVYFPEFLLGQWWFWLLDLIYKQLPCVTFQFPHGLQARVLECREK